MSNVRANSRYCPVDTSVELHYLEKGEGKPLLFIPGLTFSGEIFRAQIEHFSKQYRVIAVDPRGQGLSSKPVDGNDYMTHGRDLAALIDALGLEDVVLIGWSTGNLDAWSYIRQAGFGKLRGVVTIDMSPLPLSPGPAWWTEGTIEELSGIATSVMNSPKGVRDFFSDYVTSTMIQRAVPDEELEALLDQSARTPYWVCKALFCDAIFSNYLDTAKETGERIPSLMCIAEHWADVAKPFVERELPGTKIRVMGGHLMFYEYPDRWNGVLEEFLADLP